MAADEKLDWELRIHDLMSGPLAKIEERFAALDKAMGQLADDKFEKATGKKAKEAEDKIGKALAGAKEKLTSARADFAQAWAALLDTSIAKRAGGIASSIGGRVQDVFAAIQGKAGGLFGKAGGIVGGLFDRMKPGFARVGAFLSPITSRIGAAWSTISDGLSRVGASAGKVLGPIGSGLGKVFGSVGQLAGALGSKLGPAFGKLGSYAGAGVGAMVGIAGALGGAAVAITVAAGKWALHGLEFKEDTLASLKVMTGTEDAARRIFKSALGFESKSAYDLQTLVGAQKSLISAGFKEGELDRLMRGVGDVGARSNNDPQKMGSAIAALSKINAIGKLTGEHLAMLSDAGVSQKAILAELAGKHGGSADSAMAAVSGGQVKAAEGVDAIMKAIEKTISGGKLGGLMESQSNTLSGLIRRVGNIPELLLLGSEGMSKATDPIKKALTGIVNAFQHGQPLFVKAEHALDRIGAAWGKAFGELGKADANGLLGNVIDAIEEFFTAAAPFAEGFFPQMMKEISKIFGLLGGDASPEEIKKKGEDVAKALGLIASAIIFLGSALAWIVDKFVWIFEKLGKYAAWATGGPSDDQVKASEEEFARQREAMRLYKAQQGGAVVAGADAASPQVTTTVGDVYVQVAPGDEKAGVRVANKIQGQMPGQLSNYATEMGG